VEKIKEEGKISGPIGRRKKKKEKKENKKKKVLDIS